MRRTRSNTNNLPKKKVPTRKSVFTHELSSNERMELAKRIARMPTSHSGSTPSPIPIRRSGPIGLKLDKEAVVAEMEKHKKWNSKKIDKNTKAFTHLASIKHLGENPFQTGDETQSHTASNKSHTASNKSYNGATGKATKRKYRKSKPKKRTKTGGNKPSSINLLRKTRKRKQKKRRP